jgi:hypothetical protein
MMMKAILPDERRWDTQPRTVAVAPLWPARFEIVEKSCTRFWGESEHGKVETAEVNRDGGGLQLQRKLQRKHQHQHQHQHAVPVLVSSNKHSASPDPHTP